MTCRDLSAVDHVGVEEIVEHYEDIIRELDSTPIIMGHSFAGGARSPRSCSTADWERRWRGDRPAPVKGILTLPFSTLKSSFPALKTRQRSQGRHPDPEGVPLRFTNTLTDEESLAAPDERYAVPGPGRVLFQAGLANFNPRAATKVDSKTTTAHRCS